MRLEIRILVNLATSQPAHLEEKESLSFQSVPLPKLGDIEILFTS